MFTWDHVKQLLTEYQAPTLSLYLDIDAAKQENQATTAAWQIWLKNTLRDYEARLSQDEMIAWQPLRDQLDEFLTGFTPDSKGLALFINREGYEVFPLRLPIENRIAFGEPSVAPLIWQLDEYERYLIVLVDQQEARFFTAYLGEADFQESVEIDLEGYDFQDRTSYHNAAAGSVQGQAGSPRDQFENMIDEHRARYYRSVVDEIEKQSQKQGTTRVILGGVEESAHAVRNFMNDKQAEKIVSIVSIPMRSSMQEILDRVQPVAYAYERENETTLLQQVIDFAKSGGRGALGQKAVSEALEQQRVELLIASWPLEDEAHFQQLAEQAFMSSGSIELVHGEVAERLRQEGGIAARLYYAITEA